jgi:hypothetical protein
VHSEGLLQDYMIDEKRCREGFAGCKVCLCRDAG